LERYFQLPLVWIAAAALGLATSEAVRSAQPGADKRSQAIALYNAKDYRGAAQLLDNLWTVNNRDPYAAYYAALAHQQLGNSAQSLFYYKQVFTLAPTSQVGGYAKSILLKLDPSFAASNARQTAANASIPSTEEGLAKAIIALPSNDEVPALDQTLPTECRIPFKNSTQGIFLDCFFNGRPIAMKFDSGAPNIVVGKNQLQTLGISAPTGKSDGFTPATASSEPVAYWMIRATIKVGQIEQRDIPVMVMEIDHSDPLLGQTFFKNFDCTIDNGGGQIKLRQKGMAAKESAGDAAVGVPFTYKEDGNRLLVNVEVEGKPTLMIFDPTNTATNLSFVTAAQAERAGIKIPADARTIQRYLPAGLSVTKNFNLQRMRLGPIDRADVPVSVSLYTNEPIGVDAPLLGQPFWQGYEYTIDTKKKLIYFVRH
jgi:predicted aspartyl protease